jgi:hypothetical protein
MYKLLSLFTWQYFTFKYIFKIFMKIIMNLEAAAVSDTNIKDGHIVYDSIPRIY